MCQSLIDLRNDGIEIGKREGKKEGETIGIQESIFQLLTIKLGKISNEVILEIKKSNKEKLNRLLNKVFDIASEEDIYNALNS